MYINAAPQTQPTHIYAAYNFLISRRASLHLPLCSTRNAQRRLAGTSIARAVRAAIDNKTTERLTLCFPPYKRTTPALRLPKATRFEGKEMPKKPLVASPRTADQPNDEESKNDKK